MSGQRRAGARGGPSPGRDRVYATDATPLRGSGVTPRESATAAPPVALRRVGLAADVVIEAVSLIITGMQSYRTIDPNDGAPLATAFTAVGVPWIGHVVAFGACIGLTVVCMILMLGQTRVAFAMARDGLLPRGLARVHPKYGTPYRITLVTATAVALISGFVDLTELANLVNIGTLFAFILVSIGVVVLRRRRPDLPRPFRVPAAPVVATLSTILCFYLMLNLVGVTWLRFVVWMALGFIVYFAYSRSHSRLETERDADPGSRSTAK